MVGIEIIITLIIMSIFVFIGTQCLEWSSHIDIVKSYTEKYGWSSFKTFKKNFDATEWTDMDNDKYYVSRYLNKNLISKTSQYIFKFNNIGMIMKTPLAFFRARRYIIKYKKAMNKKELYKWE